MQLSIAHAWFVGTVKDSVNNIIANSPLVAVGAMTHPHTDNLNIDPAAHDVTNPPSRN